MKILVSASILSADLCFLGAELARTERAGTDYVHFDVMDGVFVNNISYGLPVLRAVKKNTSLPADVHLMITEPHRYIEKFAEAGADIITFHLEAESRPLDTIKAIRSLGKKAGIAVKPATPVSELLPFVKEADMVLVMTVEPGFGGQGLIHSTEEKICAVRRYADENGLALDIEVDGGINGETASAVIKDGANVLVSGSYLYKASDMGQAVMSIRNAGL